MDFHFLADALQIFVVMRDRATLNDLADTRSFYHRIGDANFVDIGGTLVRAPQYSRPVRNKPIRSLSLTAMARPLCTPIFRPRGTCASSPGAERSEALGKVVAQIIVLDGR